jgi:DNA-binding MarR family transcriptional regulator
MAKAPGDLCDQVLTTIRRLIRAIDLHSRQLVRSHGLTSPQALTLSTLIRDGDCTVGELAKQLSLSQATLTDILNRLVKRGLVQRSRSTIDKRRVQVTATRQAKELLKDAPPLLQERFLVEFRNLADWEQSLLLSSLQRIATMMDAEHIEAAPVLSNGPMTASPGVPDLVEKLASLETPPQRAASEGQSELGAHEGGHYP